MRSRATGILKILHAILIIYTVMYVAESTLVYYESSLLWYKMILVAPLILVSFIIYNISGRLWIYVGLQAALLVTAFMLPGEYTVSYVATVVICFAFQVHEKRTGYFALLDPDWPFAIFLGVLYFITLYTEREYCGEYIIYALMVYIIIVLLFNNLTGLGGFLEVRSNVKNVQLGQIYKTNIVFILGIIALLSVLFLISGFLMDNAPIYQLLDGIKWLIRGFGRWLISMLKSSKDIGNTQESEVYVTGEDEGLYDADYYADEGGMSDAVLYMLYGIVLITAAALLIMGLYKLISILRVKFGEKKLKAEDGSYEEEIISIRPVVKKENKLSRINPDDRVRALYKRTVKRARRKKGLDMSPKKYYTPSDIEKESFDDTSKEEIVKLHRMYEKTRYGSGNN